MKQIVKMDLKGKVALVTGSAKGLGLSMVTELLKHGIKGVALIDIDELNGQKVLLELHQVYGTNSAIFIKADISNEEEFEDAFQKTVNTFNQLDIVINNAGIIQEVQWRKCISVNLLGTITGSYLAMEKYLPKYKSGEEGVLINISSVLGLQPAEGTPAYVTAKHGLVGFSRAIGGPLHYDKYKVRVITICPGITDTSMPGLSEEQQHEPFRSAMNDFMKSLQKQSLDDFVKNLIPILQEGACGSVWNVIKGVRSLMEFPVIEE